MEYYTNKTWQYTSARTQAQKDGYNCGVHICAIGAALLQEKCLTDINPSKYRRKIRNTIQRQFNGIHSSTIAPSEGSLQAPGIPNDSGWEKSNLCNHTQVDHPLIPDCPNSNYSAPQTLEVINTAQDTTGNNVNIEELVRNYREFNRSSSAMSIPHELIETQTKRLTSLTTILTNECFGRHVVAKKTIQRSTTLGYYFGIMIQGAPKLENEYLLSSHTWKHYYIDGSPPVGEPTKEYTLSYINGDYGDGDLVNCKFDHEGQVYTTKRIPKGDQLFLAYGDSYSWCNLVKYMLTAMVSKINKLAAYARINGMVSIPDLYICDIQIANLTDEAIDNGIFQQGTEEILELLINVIQGRQSRNPQILLNEQSPTKD